MLHYIDSIRCYKNVKGNDIRRYSMFSSQVKYLLVKKQIFGVIRLYYLEVFEYWMVNYIKLLANLLTIELNQDT